MTRRRRSLLRADRGAMALTVSQMFLGAVSLGIGMFRGTEVQAAFHMESTLSHATTGATKLAADHARSANIVVNDNVTMAAIMGPRFAVEADNITMDANALIACPTCPVSPTCSICLQYKATKPRALAKLAWVRAKQQLLWGTLGKLSGDVDRLAFQQSSALAAAEVAKVDPKVKLRFEDPSERGEIWGGGNADVACRLSMEDTLPSPMTGHAFPLLLSKNLLEGLPQVLVQAMPRMICGVTTGAPLTLPQIKTVTDKVKDDCDALEDARCRASGTCGFDRQRCEKEKLEERTDEFLRLEMGLPKVPVNLSLSLGGSQTRKPTSGGASPAEFCACAFSEKPVDETTVTLSDAVRRIASFGAAEPSEALRKRREYASCGRWYFPSRSGPYASTPEDEQPFVAAWKWTSTGSCRGGSR